jgi:hypothetical protein
MMDTVLAMSPSVAGLRRLDHLLAAAADRVPLVYGSETASDRFRGLYISRGDIERLLDRPPGMPLFAEALDDAGQADLAGTRPGWLVDAFGLTAFDLDVVLLALAPEVDARYDRLFGYLQDDVTRRRPSVDLALNLLCHDVDDMLARRWHFSSGAPLLRERLIELVPDPNQSVPTLLGHAIRLDSQIVNLLLEQDVLDDRLAHCCRVRRPDVEDAVTPIPEDLLASLTAAARTATRDGTHLRLGLVGLPGSGRETIARAIADALGSELLVFDARTAAGRSPGAAELLLLAARHAWFNDAVLLVRDAEALIDPRAGAAGILVSALEDAPGIAIIASADALPPEHLPDGTAVVRIGACPTPVRRRLWRSALNAADQEIDEDVITELADRFRLTPACIVSAVGAAGATAGLRGASPTREDLFAAARDQTGSSLEGLATRLRPDVPWDRLVLPADEMTQLRELCDRAFHQSRVLEAWGFARRLTRGRGITALFSGPSGTGKTMAAEVLATELSVDLWRIELAGVVSKYIGETEKNLDRIFIAARNTNGILLFDEAEALFGKRSEVRDSHDRYANLEIAYLLQKMEQYEGLAILATNLRGNLDDAFVRRLAFSIHFPFPDEPGRRRIWEGIFPSETPLGDDVDLDGLARSIQLSGGHIHNIAVSASFLAAADGGRVSLQHLLHATRREYQKLGKTVGPDALINRVLKQALQSP